MRQREPRQFRTLIGTAALLLFSIVGACARPVNFLTAPLPVLPPLPLPSPSPICPCEDGFTANAENTRCIRESSVPPTRSTSSTPIQEGDFDPSYFSSSLIFASLSGNPGWPFSIYTDERLANGIIDFTGAVVPASSMPMRSEWRNRLSGNSRISIKGSEAGIWYAKTFCIDIPEARDYVLHIGADNQWMMKIDGQLFAECVQDGSSLKTCFHTGLFLGQRLESGKHLVELKYLNTGGPGALWFEVYNNTIAEARLARNDRGLNRLYTTSSMVGDVWDYEGEVCPAGYSYDVCDMQRRCTKLEQTACLSDESEKL